MPEPRTSQQRERRLAAAGGLNVVIVVLQVVAGLVAGSVGLLADAGHNLTDTAAVLLSLYAVRLARRPVSDRRSFGYLRGGVLAAQANAAGILVVTAVIAVEGVRRLLDAEPVDGAVVLVVALVGAAANGVAAWIVHEPGGGDLNVRSALLHLISDAVVSLGVAGAGAVILLTDGGWLWLDPAVSLLISLVIGAYGVRLLRQTTTVLLEGTPEGVDAADVRSDVLAVAGVQDLHDLHVWSLSDTVRAASGHLQIAGHPSLAEAAAVGAEVKRVLAARHGVAHATLELECEPCLPPSTADCAMPADATPAAHAGHRH